MRAAWTVHGRGAPVTLVVPGLAATDGEARIPASGLKGTRVVVTLPGHGNAPDAPPGYWSYARIAEDVRAVADEVGATRAVGVSLGSGAVMRIAAREPDRFERLALLLPASLDHPRAESAGRVFARLAEAVAVAPTDGGAKLRGVVHDEVPAGVDVGDYVTQRAKALLRLKDALHSLPQQTSVDDVAALSDVLADVLVIGATEDPLHPAEVSKASAAAFRQARLEILPSAAPMLTHRREVRALLTGFLNRPV